MIAFEDPDHEGNSSKYHTGEQCYNRGCTNPAGTAWGKLWCFECNVKRINRINNQFNTLLTPDRAKETD